ncbi:TolC family protein [Paludisphaera mucosa]|uniref:TolC family protein n=1 Tax=Paludisphaera mucosa TaxID=3030827 RepID=A0ABT6FEV3_9BACT|nr:TolC family protein [Paludisphaera mucosa]MDG3006099.1 TolC family protein [Paludisphaera mucosa]
MSGTQRRVIGILAPAWLLLAASIASGQSVDLPDAIPSPPRTPFPPPPSTMRRDGQAAPAEEPPVMRPGATDAMGIPEPPGITTATDKNLTIDIAQALGSQPTTGPKGVPINLAAAMQLAGATPLDIAAATARVDQALALLLQARALKIPNMNGGIGYYRHDGFNQNLFTGQGFEKGTNALQVGGGPTWTVNVTDALYAPLAARQVVGSRRADLQAARNDALLATAQTYFDVQETRGRLVGAEATIVRTERLVRFAEGLAPSLIAPLEINRARAQLQDVRQYRQTLLRDWRTSSARLAERLLLPPETMLAPVEPPFLRVVLIPPEDIGEDIVRIALASRPEIASQRQLLLAAEQQLRREKWRPLLPNLVLATPGQASAGALPAGQFYAGVHDQLQNAGGRADWTTAAYWQLTNGGVGNIGLIRQRKAEVGLQQVEVARTYYRVRSEVAQAMARLDTSSRRVPEAEEELKQAVESADKNFVGLRETTRPAGELLSLVVRPQEVVAALQVLNASFQNYASAVTEFNRAQFDMYRALGQPAQWVTSLDKPVQQIPGPATDVRPSTMPRPAAGPAAP